MKVLSVIRAESVRAVRTIAGNFGYLPTAMAALMKQYGFLGFPKAEELTAADPSKGLTFSAGKLELGEKEIAIDYLQIFPTGVSVTTHTNTTDSDLILDNVLDWARTIFQMKFEEIRPGIAHGSQLEVRLEKSLPDLFPFLSSVGAAISDSLDEWWEFRPPYELININFWIDKSKFPAAAPHIFRLDRRENIPFEQNVYWAEASLTTEKHIEVLSRLEKVCLDAL